MLLGAGMVAYLGVADWYSQKQTTYLTAKSDEAINALSEQKKAEMQKDAENFNQQLLTIENRWDLSEDMKSWYYTCLDVSGTGLMGIIYLPKLGTQIPIYHGSESRVLQVGAGHMEGSSLPIGGKSTHAVLAAHTGMVSAELFTKLDQMEIDDIFYIKILDKLLEYQVIDVQTVLPTDVKYLEIKPERDLVTLVTCTPPGINSHRLLVVGERTKLENIQRQRTDSDKWRYSELCLLSGILIFMGIIGYLIKTNLKHK